MRSIIFFILCLTTFSGVSKSTIYVLDADDNTPVGGATIFSSSGTIIGLTSDKGKFEADVNEKNLPLTVRLLGYEPAEITKVVDNSKIFLNRKSFELNEVVVSSTERPVTRIVCYLREYITAVAAGDTMIMFNEHMADFMVAGKKVKGFKPFDKPRFLRTRAYSRTAYADGRDTIYRPKYRDDTFAWDQL